ALYRSPGDGETGQPVLVHLVVDQDPPLVALALSEIQRGNGGNERDRHRGALGMDRLAAGFDDAVLGVGDLRAVTVDEFGANREGLAELGPVHLDEDDERVLRDRRG